VSLCFSFMLESEMHERMLSMFESDCSLKNESLLPETSHYRE